MSLSRIPAIARHSMSGRRSLRSDGTFFVASPIISRLRTNARFTVSSDRNSSLLRVFACAARYSASSRMWRRYLSGESDIFYFLKNVRADVRAECVRCDQLYSPLQCLFEKRSESHEMV